MKVQLATCDLVDLFGFPTLDGSNTGGILNQTLPAGEVFEVDAKVANPDTLKRVEGFAKDRKDIVINK